MKEINFLGKRRRALSKVEKKDRLYSKYAVVFFVISLLIFFVLIATKMFFDFRLEKTLDQQNKVERTLIDDEHIEVAFLVFSNKLKTIKDIFQTRSNKQEAIKFFSELFGDNVFIGGMKYSEDADILSLQYNSDHIFDLKDTFELLDSPRVTKKFPGVSRNKLSRSDDGSYGFTITIDLKEKGEPDVR